MDSIIDGEYTRRLQELLRYVPYLKEEKAKIQRFINGLLITFKDKIEFDEPRSLEEAIWKLKHCYEQSKRRSETNQTGKVMQRIKRNGIRSDQGLETQVKKRML